MKHTQGKWEVRNCKNNDNIIVGVDDRDKTYGDKIFFKVATCTNKANANLIASAPILLAKLIKIKRDINLMQKGFLNSYNSAIAEDINEHCDIAFEYCDIALVQAEWLEYCDTVLDEAEGGAK